VLQVNSNVLPIDTDRISSSCGTIQELRLVKTIRNAEKSKTKDWYHVKSSPADLRWPVPLWRIIYYVHHTAELSAISGSTLDMADIFFILSRYLWNLEHLCQTMHLVKITMCHNFLIEKYLYTDKIISARCSAECHYFIWSDRFETWCYSVSEGGLECWCCIIGGLVIRSLVAGRTIQLLSVICHVRVIKI